MNLNTPGANQKFSINMGESGGVEGTTPIQTNGPGNSAPTTPTSPGWNLSGSGHIHNDGYYLRPSCEDVYNFWEATLTPTYWTFYYVLAAGSTLASGNYALIMNNPTALATFLAFVPKFG